MCKKSHFSTIECDFGVMSEQLAGLFEDVEQLCHGGGPEHGDAGGAEVGDALEDGRGGQVPSGVDDASCLVDALHVDAQQFLQDVELVAEGESCVCHSVVDLH